ncbi:MAG: hypothetical protein KDD52_08115 [Bdellovibrionales bacterium]|nr:hypothetical protein [Bdellovibrionales bacterium]
MKIMRFLVLFVALFVSTGLLAQEEKFSLRSSDLNFHFLNVDSNMSENGSSPNVCYGEKSTVDDYNLGALEYELEGLIASNSKTVSLSSLQGSITNEMPDQTVLECQLSGQNLDLYGKHVVVSCADSSIVLSIYFSDASPASFNTGRRDAGSYKKFIRIKTLHGDYYDDGKRIDGFQIPVSYESIYNNPIQKYSYPKPQR